MAIALALAMALAPSVQAVRAQGNAAGVQFDDPRLKAVDDMVHRTLSEQNVPGYAIAIIKGGHVVYKVAHGWADLQSRQGASADTIFGLASVTKTFTALAVLHLIDEGKLRPEGTLDQYLRPETIPPTWRKMTIDQLASMRAGLPESRPNEEPWPLEMTILERQPLAYEPDSQFVYSNPSYRVLGTVIEAVTGMPYLAYIHQLILAPLGMASTGTVVTLAGTNRVAIQYDDRQGQSPIHVVAPKNPMTSFSAGMLASSVDDMCIYAQALLDKKILSPAAYNKYLVERPPLSGGQPANWAYGWGSNTNKRLNQRVNSMNGGLPGVASTIILVPDSNMAVVALSNLRKKPVYAIAKRAMMIFLSGEDIEPGQGTEHEEGQGQK